MATFTDLTSPTTSFTDQSSGADQYWDEDIIWDNGQYWDGINFSFFTFTDLLGL